MSKITTRLATASDADAIAAIYNRGQLDGEWRDCLIVETLLDNV